MSDPTDPARISARPGLDLLRNELNRSILKALSIGPMSRNELKAWLVLASASALHGHLAELVSLGAIAKRDLRRQPRRVEYEIRPAGRDLVVAIERVEDWLSRHPDRRLEAVSPLGWRAFGALADAWEYSLIQRLAPTACSEAELLATIAGLGDEKLARELQRLLGAGILEQTPSFDASSRYALSRWGRLAIGPLAAVARCERIHFAERSAPITVYDAQAALLAMLPLVGPVEHGALSVLTIELDFGRATSRSGAVWVESGEAGGTRCAAGRPPRSPDAWARGSVDGWLTAMLDGNLRSLKLGGDERAAGATITGLHQELLSRPPSGRRTHAYH